jgi:phosphoribosylaminoimidazolecarboxamide formyltransferase / IMP cyclohydrolase
MNEIKRALISVSDKTGVVEFARALAAAGVELLSTGGTATALREAGLPVQDVSAYTGFPEMLDGRVKTLHPKVHGGLLFLRDNQEHVQTAQAHGIEPIDLVCVNLYPFEATVARAGVTFEEAVEQIDIGGPAMLRSAAKNMQSVTVVVDPSDYPRVLDSMAAHGGATARELRVELARKVYARVAAYNAAIASYLAAQSADAEGVPPLVLAYDAGEALRYGENPHQAAALYRDAAPREAGIAQTEQLHGKELSYNNYLDGDAALEAVKELAGENGVAIIKHSNPCGYATGATLAAAFEAAWAGDTVSAFGSVIAVTATVDLAMAECLKGRFVEVLIAPDYNDDALAFLRQKSKDLRILKLRHPLEANRAGRVIRQIGGGLLVQDRDNGLAADWSTPTAHAFPESMRPLADFGMKVCKHIKSNAIALVREYAPGQFALLGMGAGQPNRVDSLRKLAVARAHENLGPSGDLAECVLISDAFFPFADSIEHAAAAGIRFIVQPGGSKRDDEVVAACDTHGIAMAFTGMRHFRH